MSKAKSIIRITRLAVVTLIFMFSSLVSAWGDVVELNPGYIDGTVAIEGVDLSYAGINGNSGTYNANTSASASPGSSSINYNMTVNVPTGTTPTWSVTANTRSDSNHDYVYFNSQSVSVSAGSTSTSNFILSNPGFVKGNFSVTGGTLSSASINVYPASGNLPRSYTSTSSSRAGNYNVHVFPGSNLRVNATLRLTDGRTVNLPQRRVNVDAGETVTLDYSYDVPQVDEGSLTVNVASNGSKSPNQQRISISGPPSKNKTLNGNGSYTFSGLPVGSYHVNNYLYFNNYKDYFRVPRGTYSPYSANQRWQVNAGEETEVSVSYDQSFINGNLEVTGSALLSELSSAQINVNGVYDSSHPTRGLTYAGNGRTRTSNGPYQLILSEGDWDISYIYLYFYNNSSNPDENLSSQVYYYPPSQSRRVSTSPSQPGTKDFTLPTGEVTVTFRIAGNTGATMSNPRLSRTCSKKDENGNTIYSYSIYANNSSQQNVEVGKVRFYGLEGTCKLLAQATVGGGTTTFGEVEFEVIPGTSQVIDIGGPTLAVSSPSVDYITSNSSISVSGTATDDVGVESVTVNGSTTTLSSTNNSSDPNEVSFSSTVSLDRGPNTIKTVATDSSGKIGEDTRTVYRDEGVPTLSFTPADKTTVASGGAVTIVTLSGTANDDAGIKSVTVQDNTVSFASTGNGNEVSYEATLELTDGDNFITVVVTDISNRTTTETHKVTVSDADTIPPVLSVPNDVIAEATGSTTTVSIGSATATDNVTPPGSITITSDAPTSYPLGTTTVTWTATDEAGNIASATQNVTVEDTTAPTFNFSQLTSQLWPPNKKMVLSGTLSGVNDAVTANPDVNISITSNQGGSDDWNVTQSGDVWNIELRADRLGNDTERVYNISVEVTDDAGYTSSTTATVIVPHDQGQNKGGGKKK